MSTRNLWTEASRRKGRPDKATLRMTNSRMLALALSASIYRNSTFFNIAEAFSPASIEDRDVNLSSWSPERPLKFSVRFRRWAKFYREKKARARKPHNSSPLSVLCPLIGGRFPSTVSRGRRKNRGGNREEKH